MGRNSRLWSWLLGGAMLLLAAGCDMGGPSGGPVATDSPGGTATLPYGYDVPATITALATVGAGATVTFADFPRPQNVDACSYLEAEDIEATLGVKLVETPRAPNDSTADCTFSGDAEYVTLSIYEFGSEAEPAYLVRPPGTPAPGPNASPGEFLPGLGDGAVLGQIGVRQSTGPDAAAKGWNLRFKLGSRYLTLRWFTSNVESGDGLIKLARKIIERL
ncbi:MAG: hypothetical protein M3328_00525 [Chloroflexota bacterium]|nr:hypothetical protein [Chloroflexota bacterium]